MPDTPQPSLLDRMNAQYELLRASDGTIRRYEREITTHTDTIRVAHQLRKIATLAIRHQEKWLKEEAAEIVRKEAGVKTIPGFASRRESAREFRMKLDQQVRDANARAKALLSPPPP